MGKKEIEAQRRRIAESLENILRINTEIEIEMGDLHPSCGEIYRILGLKNGMYIFSSDNGFVATYYKKKVKYQIIITKIIKK